MKKIHFNSFKIEQQTGFFPCNSGIVNICNKYTSPLTFDFISC